MIAFFSLVPNKKIESNICISTIDRIIISSTHQQKRISKVFRVFNRLDRMSREWLKQFILYVYVVSDIHQLASTWFDIATHFASSAQGETKQLIDKITICISLLPSWRKIISQFLNDVTTRMAEVRENCNQNEIQMEAILVTTERTRIVIYKNERRKWWSSVYAVTYNACLEFKFERQHGLKRIHFSDHKAQRKWSTLMRVYQEIVFVDKCSILV